MNNAGLGFALLLAGLAVFASALNRTTGAMLTGLLYGEAALQQPGSGAGSGEAPVGGTSVADAQNSLPGNSQRAGIIKVTPKGGVPGLTVPIIDPKLLG